MGDAFLALPARWRQAPLTAEPTVFQWYIWLLFFGEYPISYDDRRLINAMVYEPEG